MFVAKNAWAELRRHPWRTALMVIVSLLVTMWSVFGAAVMHEYHTAHGEGYGALKPQAVVRMTDTALSDRSGDDADWTKRYITWEEYNVLGAAAQAKHVQFDYSVVASVPVRSTGSFKAITTSATSGASQNETGGDFTLTSFYNEAAVDANEYGTFKVVEGNKLNYQDVTARDALVSQELAKKNNLKVGSTITVGNPANAKTTYTFTVGGIYTYTDTPQGVQGADAQFAKDNRNNVIYTSYYDFAASGLDTTEGTGWAVPDINIVFTLANPQAYEQFKSALKPDLPEGFAVSSPTIDAYNHSLELLDQLANTTKVMLICLWSVGGALALLLTLLEACPRREEIGYGLAVGITKSRMAWQFMVEILLQTVLGVALGLLIGGWTANPLATQLAQGHTIAMHGGVLWNVAWIALLACLLLAIIAGVRVALFRTAQLTRSPYLDSADPTTKEQ
ncbi:ABC transporter permease [Bifidobacterium pseudolongum subsp. globosum]|uniref:ABC transporter permease n=1 Tax=Bifidobacterium pseudolongum PV8-2 TaxID=1447715 RepID=A0A0A7IA10_9BIFI|nr:ABC transporter permease [Bifidobacterium pseudolongum]AIZ16871.1 ABC transporter permease [Bifidobacterium pseudolongum PV8-2]PKU98960.1 ABC transporter permease [Bifidobacterium pseudolongum subsp. globosum]RYQ57946.1 ABC transporter permease [Bifidobacterium pseudolongum subsp. globosum]